MRISISHGTLIAMAPRPSNAFHELLLSTNLKFVYKHESKENVFHELLGDISSITSTNTPFVLRISGRCRKKML